MTSLHAGSRRRARGSRGAATASVVAAALFHLALAGAATATGVLSGWSFGMPAEAAQAAATRPPGRPLRPSCDGEALLAVGARSLLCASPFVDDRAACVTDLGNRLESDRLRCHLDQLDAALVTITPIDLDKLTQIDPEMLLDEDLAPAPPPPPPAPAIALQPQQPPPPPPPPPPEVRQREEQIVEVAKAPPTEAPVDSRFLAEQNSKVEHQTVARGSVDEPMIAKPHDEQLAIKPDARDPASTKPPEDRGVRPDAPPAPTTLSMRTPGPRLPSEVAQEERTVGPEGGATGPRGDGTQRARGNSLFAAEARQRASSPGEDGGGGGGEPRPDLRPTADILERVAGGGSVDHLDDVDVGDETALNSRSSVYATFFNRLKRGVRQRWHPDEVWARHDPTLAVNGFKDRVTRLRVSLSPSGDVVQIMVAEPSGVSYLDDEAIRAFRAAQPFPNPPRALVNSAGVITFTFGFYVTVSGARTDWRYNGG